MQAIRADLVGPHTPRGPLCFRPAPSWSLQRAPAVHGRCRGPPAESASTRPPPAKVSATPSSNVSRGSAGKPPRATTVPPTRLRPRSRLSPAVHLSRPGARSARGCRRAPRHVETSRARRDAGHIVGAACHPLPERERGALQCAGRGPRGASAERRRLPLRLPAALLRHRPDGCDADGAEFVTWASPHHTADARASAFTRRWRESVNVPMFTRIPCALPSAVLRWQP